MSPHTISTAEQQRRSQIAAAAYERGRRAAFAAARRRSLYQREHDRGESVRSRPHSYEQRSDSRAPGLLNSDVALARAAAYLAAASVAHELVASELIPDTESAQDWSRATSNRTEVHEDAWRERLTNAGIDDAVLRPGISLEVLELPTELESLDFDDIAEHTFDVSATSSDLEPIRLSDLMLETPRSTRSRDDSVIDITDRVARVIEIDRSADAGIEGGVDAW